jgi:hypothetical protein
MQNTMKLLRNHDQIGHTLAGNERSGVIEQTTSRDKPLPGCGLYV